MLDYVDDDLYLVDEDVERENDNENGEVEAENEETQTIIGNETAQPKITMPSLMNICEDPLINNNAKFLNALKHVFGCNETNGILKRHIKI